MEEKTNQRFYILLSSTLSIVGVGTVFYYFYEGFTLVDSIYFSVVTLGTVGYGDVYPTTDLGKIFTSAYIIIGIGIIVAFAEIIADRIVKRRIEHKNRD